MRKLRVPMHACLRIGKIPSRACSIALAVALVAGLMPAPEVAWAKVDNSNQFAQAESIGTSSGTPDVVLSAEMASDMISGNFKYRIDDNTSAIITGYVEKEAIPNQLVIPSNIEGYTVTAVGNGAFEGCGNLASVSLPGSLREIGARAFEGCASLASVSLPEGLAYLGADAFRGDDLIESVTVPASLERCGYGFYSGGDRGPFGDGLKEVSFAPGATVVPEGLLLGCAGIESVDLPEGIESVGEYALGECGNLASVSLPGSLRKIGGHAFEGCGKLEAVSFEGNDPNNLKISNNAFRQCPRLTIKGSRNSSALIHATQNNIAFEITDYSRSLLNDAETNFSAQQLECGWIDFRASYQFGDSTTAISATSVEIWIPENTTVKTVRVNGNETSSYEIYYIEDKKQCLTIECDGAQGEIEAMIEPPATSEQFASYATVNYAEGSTRKLEVIDVLNNLGGSITLNAPEKTASGSFSVSGFAAPQKDISISIDGTEVAQTQSSKSGRYKTTVDIPSPEADRSYRVTAASIDANGQPVEASRSVLFDSDSASITKFVMRYKGRSFDLLQMSNPRLTFYLTSFGGTPFTFEVGLDAPQANISNVYVASTRDGQSRTLEAKWDEVAECYIASGWFDPDDHNYVPGNLSVSVSNNPQERRIDLSGDNPNSSWISVPESLKDSVSVNKVAIDDDTYRLDYTSKDGSESYGSVTVESEPIPDGMTQENASEYGFEKISCMSIGPESEIAVNSISPMGALRFTRTQTALLTRLRHTELKTSNLRLSTSQKGNV